MIYFFLNLLLAFVWLLINGDYSSLDFLIGFIVGFFALRMSQPFGLKTAYFRKFKAVVMLYLYFMKELFASVGKVVWDVLTPQHLSKPAIIQVPLSVKSDLEITLLANMISLTPGTLSLDVITGNNGQPSLVIHAMFVEDEQVIIDSIKQGMEARLLELTRN